MTGMAIVTGSDSGIGRASAVALAAAGFDVGVTWHSDEAGAQKTAAEVAEHSRRAVVRRLDLADPPAAADTVDDVAEELGGLDVLVNNAGTGSGAPFLDLDYADWRKTLTVDLDGAFLVAQRAARRMVDQGRGGRIINVTSVHEHYPLVGSAAYCAAKAGLGLLTKVMAVELAEYGITVNAVAPGEIATPMTGQADEDPRGKDRPGIPVGRPGDAREIAAVIGFLAGGAAGYVTGASWLADGGMTLLGPTMNRARDPRWRD
jgi:NAD(P)-dependent dehydrogenase (short-subunit alcohol dehydrogenase family)